MKKFFIVFIVLFLSLVVQARTIEEALANSEVAMQKAGAFVKNFGTEEKADSYPLTSEEVAIAVCRAFAKVDFDKMLTYFEDGSKKRVGKQFKSIKDSPRFYELQDKILSANEKCKIDSIEKDPLGYKTYIFGLNSMVDPMTVDRVDDKYVVVDNIFIKNKKNKGSTNFSKKAKKYMQQDYKELETIQVTYPETSKELAILTCKAFKEMDWDTIYSFTASSLQSELQKEIESMKKHKEELKEFSKMDCEILSYRKLRNQKVKYEFSVLGSMYIKFSPKIDSWKIVSF